MKGLPVGAELGVSITVPICFRCPPMVCTKWKTKGRTARLLASFVQQNKCNYWYIPVDQWRESVFRLGRAPVLRHQVFQDSVGAVSQSCEADEIANSNPEEREAD